MPKSKEGSAHDALFRHVFSHPDAAADLITQTLPAVITETLDLSRLTVHQKSYVSEQLRSTHSDLLIELPRQDSQDAVFVYVLVEHKSMPDRWTLLQLLGYLVDIWKQYRRDHPKKNQLPVIIPLIFSHAPRRWPFPLDFGSLVEVQSRKELAYTPQFSAALHEIAGKTAAEIHGGTRFVTAVRMLQARREVAMLLRESILQVRDTLPDDDRSRAFLNAILEYAFRVSPEPIETLIESVRETAYRPAEDVMMTAAQQLMQRGAIKGRIEDKQAVLTRLVDRKFGITDVEQGLIGSTADIDKLDAALDALVDGKDKESILNLLK